MKFGAHLLRVGCCRAPATPQLEGSCTGHGDAHPLDNCRGVLHSLLLPLGEKTTKSLLV